MSTRSNGKVFRPSWRTYCPSWSSGIFILEVTIPLSDRDFKFEMESLVYFKICGDLKEVSITKVVPNHPFHLSNFLRVL
jgi:hypothetical protein